MERKCVQMIDTLFGFFGLFPDSPLYRIQDGVICSFKIFLLVASELDCVVRIGRRPSRHCLLTSNAMEVNSIWGKSGICQPEAESGSERGVCSAVRHGSSERISILVPHFQVHPLNSIREYTERDARTETFSARHREQSQCLLSLFGLNIL